MKKEQELLKPITGPRHRKNRIAFRPNPLFFTILVVAIAIVLWQLLIKSSMFVATPSQIIGAAPDTWAQYSSALEFTLREYVVAFSLSILIGVPLGFLIGWSKSVFKALDPLLGFALVAPKVAFVPLILIWFGIRGIAPAVALGVALGVFPIIINTMAGVRKVRPEYMTLAKSIGMNQSSTYRKIMLPSFYPQLLVGMFLGSALAMTGAVLIEMLISSPGIGALMLEYSNFFASAQLYASLSFTIIVSLAINGSLWYLYKHFENRNKD